MCGSPGRGRGLPLRGRDVRLGGRSGRLGIREDRRRPEPLDDAVDAEQQLPEELRDRRDALQCVAALEQPEHDGDPGEHDQGISDESEVQ